MLNFTETSTIKFPKLMIHSFILIIALTFISLFVTDIINVISGKNMKANDIFVDIFVVIWLFYALQSKKYRKA